MKRQREEIKHNEVSKIHNFFKCKKQNCNYKTKYNHHLKSHMMFKHNEGITYHYCIHDGCNKKFKSQGNLNHHVKNVHVKNSSYFVCDICYTFKTKYKGGLKKHKRIIHSKVPMFFYCPIKGCIHKTKYKDKIKIHLRNVHEINVKYYFCDKDNCKKRFKEKYSLLNHIKNVHSPKQKYFNCEKCKFQSKYKSSLMKHKNVFHLKNPRLYKCTFSDCNFVSKHKESLNTHFKYIHYGDNIPDLSCTQPGCQYKTKHQASLKMHESNVHNINVKYEVCTQENCNYKSKQKGKVNRHLRNVHDIGDFKCELCIRACAKLTSWKCDKTQKSFKICRRCYRKTTGYKTRVEKDIVEWLQQNFPHPIVRKDQTIKGNACLKYRPDIMYIGGLENVTIIVEVDEYQHKRSNKNYKCDEKRMSELYDETSGLVVFVRYNPHNYKPPEGKRKLKSGEERRKVLLETLNHIIKNRKELEKVAPLHVFYICYDKDNKIIAQNILKYMIY